MRIRYRICWSLLFVCGVIAAPWLGGCQASKATSQITVWEGPRLKHGRMSANLGALVTKEGRIVVIGGSPTEYPFVPLEGTSAIEVADSKCILAPSCINEKEQCQCWSEAGINVNVPLSGQAHQLPDGRILVFASVYVFDRASNRTDPKPVADEPTSGPVSAVIIDLAKKTVTPIYRPQNNEVGKPPLKGSLALLQRAFERDVKLKDGRIVRIGGHLIYSSPKPKASCKEERCTYCVGDKCTPPERPIGCASDDQCPSKDGASQFTVLDTIEIYTPPDAANPLGSVKTINMDGGRSSTGAVELDDGRVLIMGGWGPKGDGSNQNYLSTYYLDPNKPAISQGPKMLFYREDHGVARMSDGRILITGGTDHNEITINSSEIFDPKMGIFLPAPSMTLTREDHMVIQLGPWLMFLGGEVNDKADQIRNTAELYDATTAAYIGPIFLFSRPTSGEFKGFAGVTDASVLPLDENTVILFGGQQGLQDDQGEYVSAGKGSTRSVIFQYRP